MSLLLDRCFGSTPSKWMMTITLYQKLTDYMFLERGTTSKACLKISMMFVHLKQTTNNKIAFLYIYASRCRQSIILFKEDITINV